MSIIRGARSVAVRWPTLVSVATSSTAEKTPLPSNVIEVHEGHVELRLPDLLKILRIEIHIFGRVFERHASLLAELRYASCSERGGSTLWAPTRIRMRTPTARRAKALPYEQPAQRRRATRASEAMPAEKLARETRGGVNRRALPDERGRERPL
jgi:hypothetical protein